MALGLKIFRVRDRSMEPFLMDGDFALVRMNPKRVREGDVVVLEDPRNSKKIIKRVERIREGGDCYVVGDNRQMSTDSRSFGPVPMEQIVGKLVFKV